MDIIEFLFDKESKTYLLEVKTCKGNYFFKDLAINILNFIVSEHRLIASAKNNE